MTDNLLNEPKRIKRLMNISDKQIKFPPGNWKKATMADGMNYTRRIGEV